LASFVQLERERAGSICSQSKEQPSSPASNGNSSGNREIASTGLCIFAQTSVLQIPNLPGYYATRTQVWIDFFDREMAISFSIATGQNKRRKL
jgi:hypothetical protein